VNRVGAARAIHAVPRGPRTKGKGPGGRGRDKYDAVVAEMYRDPRMPRKTREIGLLMAWLICRDPNPFGAGVWKRAEAILGFEKYGRFNRSVAALLLADDLPRYEVDRTTPEWFEQTCAAPMIRRTGVCGQPARDHSYTADSETGWLTPVWYCRRHEGFGKDCGRILDQAPEPIPNRGGLLTRYFLRKNGVDGWVQDYRWAAHTDDPWRHTEWTPPSYGVVADRWPTPGAEVSERPQVPMLQLVAVEGELVDGQTSPIEGDRVT
jgi:hypothetical protein